MLVGGVLLLWIAVKLLTQDENSKTDHIEPGDNLWRAVRIIAIADVVMSLDNVIAIAAAAKGSYSLLMFGLAFSIPLIMAGAALVMALLERFPVVVWAGAALLGWIAGEVIVKDPLISGLFEPAMAHKLHYVGAMVGALLVVTLGVAFRHFRKPSRVGSS
jgi:YjbE family integral membrane protein